MTRSRRMFPEIYEKVTSTARRFFKNLIFQLINRETHLPFNHFPSNDINEARRENSVLLNYSSRHKRGSRYFALIIPPVSRNAARGYKYCVERERARACSFFPFLFHFTSFSLLLLFFSSFSYATQASVQKAKAVPLEGSREKRYEMPEKPVEE